MAGLLLLPFTLRAETPAADKPAATKTAVVADKDHLIKGGLDVTFNITALGGEKEIREGTMAEVRFTIRDANTKAPVAGLVPAAWLDIGNVVEGKPGTERECKDKIALYLKGIVGIRPLVDLNSYYLLVLNQDPSISVIDPVVSMTGKTSLYASVQIKKSGADWVRTADQKRLFVSMPKADQVAVINTDVFKVEGYADAGDEPTRVVLQPDGKYLWVGNNGKGDKSGVTAIDTTTLKKAMHFPTGKGHHEITVTGDNKLAFVTNREEGTVTVIDIQAKKKVKDIKLGGVPISLGFSELSKQVYVADGRSGDVVVIDPAKLEAKKRIPTAPGLGPLRFTDDGRYAFVVNPAKDKVYVIDPSVDEVIHDLEVGSQPFQVTFTRAFAYVRSLGTEKVTMINLTALGKGKKVPTEQGFKAGAGAPRLAGDLVLADSVSPARTDAAVFVVNPVENNTYFYMEGMNAPAGNFSSYGHAARAGLVVDRSLKETEPGVYSTKVRIPVAGNYDVAFLLDSPTVLHCFGMEAKENKLLAQKVARPTVQYMNDNWKVPVSPSMSLRFKVVEGEAPKAGLKDVRVRYFMAPGQKHDEVAAKEVGGGVYEVPLAINEEGAWYVYVSSPSGKFGYQDVPFLTLRAVTDAAKGEKPATKSGS